MTSLKVTFSPSSSPALGFVDSPVDGADGELWELDGDGSMLVEGLRQLLPRITSCGAAVSTIAPPVWSSVWLRDDVRSPWLRCKGDASEISSAGGGEVRDGGAEAARASGDDSGATGGGGRGERDVHRVRGAGGQCADADDHHSDCVGARGKAGGVVAGFLSWALFA